jgi:hypothetical protein
MTMTIPTDETVTRTVSRLLPDRTYVRATVGLNYLAGNSAAYWTATGEVYEPRGTWSGEARHRNGRDFDMGGQVHAELLRAFPQLAPIVALHLSSPTGVPMYAVENGRYFLERGEVETAARLLRVDVADLPEPDDLPAFVDSQRERWAREAAEAYALLLELDADAA